MSGGYVPGAALHCQSAFGSASGPTRLAAPNAPLPVVLVDSDLQPVGLRSGASFDGGQQTLADMLCQQLGCSVVHRQQNAITMRKDPPAAVGNKDRLDLASSFRHANQRMARRQQNMMIQLVGDRLELVTEGNEVNDILIFV